MTARMIGPRQKPGPQSTRTAAETREARRLANQKLLSKPGASRLVYERGIRHHYGIEVEDVARMANAQGLSCAVCRRSLMLDHDTHIDHCHQTGKIRALLCRRCNTSLGCADDDPNRLREMANYIERHRHAHG